MHSNPVCFFALHKLTKNKDYINVINSLILGVKINRHENEDTFGVTDITKPKLLFLWSVLGGLCVLAMKTKPGNFSQDVPNFFSSPLPPNLCVKIVSCSRR